MKRHAVAGRTAVTSLLLFAATLSVAHAASPASPSVGPSHPRISWRGGPLAGTAQDQSQCTSVSCDSFAFTSEVPRDYWRHSPGGLVIRIDWSGELDELDLYVSDPLGRTVTSSHFGGRHFQQAYVASPIPGTYRVEIVGFAATHTTYAGSVSLVADKTGAAGIAPSSLQFSHSLVDPQILVAEPGIWTADDGRVYVSAPEGLTILTSYVWRSDDGARTFHLIPSRIAGRIDDPRSRPCSVSAGGGDADVVTDRTGRLYFADLEGGSVTIGVSTDRGQTWSCNPVAASTPEVDRPWLAPAPSADGTGPNIDAYMCYIDLAVGQFPGGKFVKPIKVHVDATRDGGRTWTAAASFGDGLVPAPGPIFVARDGTIYEVFQGANAVWLARSTDQGRTFALKKVSQRFGDPGNQFVAGDVDAAGNVYTAWVDSGSYKVVYSMSSDRGDHWSAPVAVSPPNQTTLEPWLTAGKAGDVAISWYGAAGNFLPEFANSSTPWNTWAARTVDATASAPRFEVGVMSDSPVHMGPICTDCSGHTSLGDFFKIRIGAAGQLFGVYDDTTRIDVPAAGDTSGATHPFVICARQIGGLGMTTNALKEANQLNDSGDGSDQLASPALDLTGLPNASSVSSDVRIRFSLARAGGALASVVTSNPGFTDAYWIGIWKAHGYVEYVGMHVGTLGKVDFFGGDRPTGVAIASAGADERDVFYPAMFHLSGRVDQRSGVVTIDAPKKLLHLTSMDRLLDLQFFSMLGRTSERTTYTVMTVVDSTPSVSVGVR